MALYPSTLHYTTLHYTTLHYTTLHYTTLHYTTLHYTTLHYTTLHYTTLHYTTLHSAHPIYPTSISVHYTEEVSESVSHTFSQRLMKIYFIYNVLQKQTYS